MESPFLDLMSTTIRRQAFVRYSTDGYEGTRTYSTAASTYAARVIEKRERVLDKMGQETLTSHVAWVNSTAAWSVEDKTTWRGSTWRVVALDRMTDETAVVHHTKLYMRA